MMLSGSFHCILLLLIYICSYLTTTASSYSGYQSQLQSKCYDDHSSTTKAIFDIRAGAQQNHKQNKNPISKQKTKVNGKGNSKSKAKYDDEDDDVDNAENRKANNNLAPMKRGKKKTSSILSFGVDRLAHLQSISMKVGKAGAKTVFDLLSNKHVTQQQIVGKWKIMQDIQIRPGVIINFPATIQFYEDGSLKTFFESKEYVSTYEFTENAWPRKCIIKFDAKACIMTGDSEPVLLSYKGYFKRSLMKPNIILMRGKIYKLSGTAFWKKQKKIGKFKATQRRYG